jgi:hypothetical protein
MSSRHLRAIQQEQLKNIIKLNEDKNSEEEIEVVRKTNFVFSSDDDDSSDDDVDNKEIINISLNIKNLNTKDLKSINKNNEENDIDIIESFISKDCITNNNDNIIDNINIKLFDIDKDKLNIDHLMRKRFGGEVNVKPDNEGGGKKKNNKKLIQTSNATTHRKLIFGIPKEDWIKPYSFMGGGIGLKECFIIEKDNSNNNNNNKNKYFEFHYSKEYDKVNDEFNNVQNTGDANRLVIFLSHNPCHTEGLLQLAMIFARTGDMDKAGNLVRRTLYIYECSFIKQFDFSSNCKMKSNIKANSIFFSTLFRHMQMSCLLGLNSISADLAKIIYNLDSINDPFNILLLLDSYLVRSGQTSMIKKIIGFNQSLSNLIFDSPVIIGSIPPSSDDSNDNNKESKVKLSNLPNWHYSFALSLFLQEHQNLTKNENQSDQNNNEIFPSSSIILQNCFELYPFMLIPLLKHANVDIASSLWKKILNNSYFLLSSSRLSPRNSYNIISEAYATKNGSIWNRDIVLHWVNQNASSFLLRKDIRKIESNQIIEYETLLKYSSLQKYNNLEIEEFLEEFPRLPGDVNPLDPRFADPRVLAGEIRIPMDDNNMQIHRNENINFINQEGVEIMNRLGLNNLRNGTPLDEELLRFQVLELQQELGIDIDIQTLMNQIHEILQQRQVDGNLDLHAPLMQLLWYEIIYLFIFLIFMSFFNFYKANFITMESFIRIYANLLLVENYYY